MKEPDKRVSLLVRQDNVFKKEIYIPHSFEEGEFNSLLQYFNKNMMNFKGTIYCFLI